MRRIALYTCSLTFVAAGCGGGGVGDGGTTGPPASAPVASVSVTLSQSVLVPGENAAATAVLRDAAGRTLTGRAINWSSSGAGVATVDGTGRITAVAPGTTVITATSEGQSGQATLTVIPPPVASVTVTLASAALVPGATTVATAVLKDAVGNTLTGRAIAWSTSAPNVATVDGAGVVAAVGPGSAIITATSEGRSGQATLTVTAPPVTSVVITGNQRVKVGDSYQYVATARIADGTVVVRPVTWSVANPADGNMTAGGTLTPLRSGVITIRATIDGAIWEGTITAYDWESASSGGSLFVSLRSDTPVTNKFGTSEYPSLVLSCSSSGYLFVWVNFTSFVTHNGLVAFGFDGGTITSETWNELSPSYGSLWYPHGNLVTRAFMNLIATARTFGFAFKEFDGGAGIARAMIFRVTGLASRLAPIMTACPSNSMRTAPTVSATELVGSVAARTGFNPQLESARQARALAGASPSSAPPLSVSAPAAETQAAIRRWK